MVAENIVNLELEGPWAVHVVEGGRELWACPKYDPDHYNEGELRAFVEIMTKSPAPVEALEILGISESGKIAKGKLLSVLRKFTLVAAEQGRVTESHSDFCKFGQTEHTLWIELKKNWGLRAGLSRKQKRRRGHVSKRAAKKAKKAKAKAGPTGRGRGRPRKAKAEQPEEREVADAASGPSRKRKRASAADSSVASMGDSASAADSSFVSVSDASIGS